MCFLWNHRVLTGLVLLLCLQMIPREYQDTPFALLQAGSPHSSQTNQKNALEKTYLNIDKSLDMGGNIEKLQGEI